MTLATRLALVTVAAVVPVAASLAYTYRREQARQQVLLEEQARRSAELLAADAGRLLGDVRTSLVRLSLLPEVRHPEREGCNERLARTVADNVAFAAIVRVDRSGRVLCSSHPSPRLAWVRQPHTRGLATTHRFAVAGYVEAAGTRAVAVAAPVFDKEQRSVVGALAAALDQGGLQQLVRHRPRVVGAVWMLVDGRGTVVAAWPEGPVRPGQPWALWSGVDGLREPGWVRAPRFARVAGHVLARAALVDGALHAVWAVSEEAAGAELRASARTSWLVLGLAAVCAAAVAWAGSRWVVLRPVRALVRAADRVRAGDLQAHTGLPHDASELGVLAAAFDDMVAALRAREAELAATYDSTLEGWSRALDLRDRETRGHTLRVTTWAVELARAMGMPEDQIVHLRRGALLHDIGKMAIPDEILHKPGPLTEEEAEVMRRHPQYAFDLLWPIAYLRPALDIPYCHHERWDGTGYPRGLKGDQIPLAARIFAVVDVWDALSSARPYRPAWPAGAVRAYLREQAGRQFDPDVVEAFLRLLDERPGEREAAP